MKNVYFVQANDVYGNDKKSTYIPYAVGCIQAYCQQNRIIAKAYNFGKFIYTRMPIEEAVKALDNPFMVLFSCSVWNTEYNKSLASRIKEAYPDCYIVFGGHNISADGEFLELYPFIDFLTHRFGEEPTEGILLALEQDTDFEKIPNISFRNKSNEIITTEKIMQTGDNYPSPYLTGVFDKILKDDICFSGLFESNRGCPNGCSFCDWSSLKSKVRLFPLDRVYKEIDWFVENKIEYIYCTDGNFCLFDRDADIADYLVECKEKYGYPQIFKAFFTKNRYNFVFDVGTKFFNSGLDKAKTISFQSMNTEVLKNVGRKNISPEFFRNLMKKYNEINIATFSELILGLPGETYKSFCEGVNSLIENGQHYAINIYPCELLPNSEMGQPAYREKYKIGSTIVPFRLIHSNKGDNKDDITEYSKYVTSTYSMSENEWCKGLLFASCIQALHNLGLLRAVAIYFRNEFNISYSDFYNDLLNYSAAKKGSLLNRVFSRIEALCSGVIKGKNELVDTCDGYGDTLWGFDELIYLEFYKESDIFYSEIKNMLAEKSYCGDVIDSLLKYQHDIVKKIGVSDIVIENIYDFYSYFCRIYSEEYASLEKKNIRLVIHDENPVNSFEEFAREVVWYGRNRRATDYTSTNYSISFGEQK